MLSTSLCYFIEVVKDMNISRAAQRLFISQQCLSEHIMRLEKHYDVRLFYRRPKLALTPAGDILYQTATKARVLESELYKRFDDLKDENRGNLRFGIFSLRANILLPQVIPAYRLAYPEVELTIRYDDTFNLLKMLEKNELDMFLGGHIAKTPGIESSIIFEERIFLIIRDDLLEKYFKDDYPGCKEEFAQGMPAVKVDDLPVILGDETSPMRNELKRFFTARQIRLNQRLVSNDHETNVKLCAASLGACFCPQIMLKYISNYNRDQVPSQRLLAFPIKDFNYKTRVALIQRKDVYQRSYEKHFIHLVRQAYAS